MKKYQLLVIIVLFACARSAVGIKSCEDITNSLTKHGINVLRSEKMTGGFADLVCKINTGSNFIVVKYFRDNQDFLNESKIFFASQNSNITPKILKTFPENRLIAMSFIDGKFVNFLDKREAKLTRKFGSVLRQYHQIEYGDSPVRDIVLEKADKILPILHGDLRNKVLFVLEKYQKFNIKHPGICHGDSWKNNFLVNKNDEVIVIDFSNSHRCSNVLLDLADLVVSYSAHESDEMHIMHGYFNRKPTKAELSEVSLLKKFAKFKVALSVLALLEGQEINLDDLILGEDWNYKTLNSAYEIGTKPFNPAEFAKALITEAFNDLR